ncbi:MAG: hypothetical protein PSV40_15615 [Polaromonas sp.]|uniref:hypothetical protein n=1 Tax=Polaromonas sp. TaxID=1869339 RepID=UPI002486F664|nr:hypothetical protein [Polaromonas sp.]MDI1270515.1 hypothetical protein [Polaromonas sp.]
MTTTPRLDLRRGVTEPVVLVISRRQVETGDIASVLTELKPFLATREDAWLYRGQMVLVVDGYNEDTRELVDIADVRAFLQGLEREWPYWAFFFNQLDDSLIIFLSCLCGAHFPDGGAVEMDLDKLQEILMRGFDGMNSIFEKHGFPEYELEAMSRGLMEVIEQAGMA